MSTRKELNLQIMDQLKVYIESNPDIRFGQALVNLGILDRKSIMLGHDRHYMYHHSDIIFEEPSDTLAKIFNTLERNSQ